jgi:hypothetical protein
MVIVLMRVLWKIIVLSDAWLRWLIVKKPHPLVRDEV